MQFERIGITRCTGMAVSSCDSSDQGKSAGFVILRDRTGGGGMRSSASVGAASGAISAATGTGAAGAAPGVAFTAATAADACLDTSFILMM